MTLKPVIIVFVAFFIIGGGLVYVQNNLFKEDTKKIPLVSINNLNLEVGIANTTTTRAQGLSGRASLPINTGLLFIFPEKAQHRFWMPDMNFPIDIIWITAGQVVGVEHEVSNVFDPDDPVFYSPPVPVEYVLEVNSGVARTYDIKVGDGVKFEHI